MADLPCNPPKSRPSSQAFSRIYSATSTPRTISTSIASSPARPLLRLRLSPAPPKPNTLLFPHRSFLTHLSPMRQAQLRRWARVTFGLVAIYWCIKLAGWVIFHEVLERRYPTPPEWPFMTRRWLREAHAARDRPDMLVPDWVSVVEKVQRALRRLEGEREVEDVEAVEEEEKGQVVTVGKDLRKKSQAWRRGYFEALMLYAKACEHVDGWVRDRTRDMAFPPDVVIGPANPRPRPIPPGAPRAPRQEDCETAYPSPHEIYSRILASQGWSPHQRIEALLAYASWLEYKGLTDRAARLYEDAVWLAAERPAVQIRPDTHTLSLNPNPPSFVLNPQTFTLNDAAGPPPLNLFQSLTAYATFHARQNDLTTSLPILISLLRAYRSLPRSPDPLPLRPRPTRRAGPASFLSPPPPYPPVPDDDGKSPPMRHAKELCEEAALNLHIGEIMYAIAAGLHGSHYPQNVPHPSPSPSSTAAALRTREEALAWTRDAVDLAEEQLHLVADEPDGPDKAAARATCRHCLRAGLENWHTMVARLARGGRRTTTTTTLSRKAEQGEAAPPPVGAEGTAEETMTTPTTTTNKQDAPSPATTAAVAPWWLGSLWGGGGNRSSGAGHPGAKDAARWAAEEEVVRERVRRARVVLDEAELPARNVFDVVSYFRA